MRILFYKTKSGKEPAREYIENLNEKQADKILWTLRTIQELDERITRQYFKKLANTDGIWEIRATFAGNIFRLLSFFDGSDLVIVAHGFTKKSQKTPAREIRTAEARKRDYEQNR